MTPVTFFFHLFALTQLMQTSWCHFEFQLRLDAIVDLKDCQDALELIHPPCETYIPKFCLRDAREPGTRSRDLSDCPLGSGGQFGPASRLPIIKPIISSQPWPGQFQLYIKARDKDDFDSDDRDDIFIDMSLAVSSHYTAAMDGTGDSNKVQMRTSFRVVCWDNYYGDSCNTFCEAQDDDVNGHYTCNSDGSFQCLNGFKNSTNNCKDVIDPCAASPCNNNGTCISLGPFNYTCQCPSGYNDTYCENETVVIQDIAPDSPWRKVSGSTITISVTGVLLAVFMVAFMISTTLLLLLMIKQKRKSQPLSKVSSGSASVKRTKLEMEAYIESTMQPNLLYDAHTAHSNLEEVKRHEYETVTPGDASINAEPNVISAQNPMFRTSSTIPRSSEQQPSQENPGYSYAEVDTRYVSARVVLSDDQRPLSSSQTDKSGSANGQSGQLPRNSVKKKDEESDAYTIVTSYNRLEHGQNTTRPQPRLAKIEGLGYDALDN